MIPQKFPRVTRNGDLPHVAAASTETTVAAYHWSTSSGRNFMRIFSRYPCKVAHTPRNKALLMVKYVELLKTHSWGLMSWRWHGGENYVCWLQTTLDLLNLLISSHYPKKSASKKIVSPRFWLVKQWATQSSKLWNISQTHLSPAIGVLESRKTGCYFLILAGLGQTGWNLK